MTAAEFEARYRRDADPWAYTTSAYERDKYAATLRACGEGPFAAALELGGSIGVFSALLAPRCRSLVTIDASETAVADARRRLAGRESVTTIAGTIPQDIPARDYDLVVASEILYYLTASQLDATLDVMRDCTRPGARLAAVHWRPSGPDRPFDAAAVHDRLRRLPWLSPVAAGGTEEYLLDVLERR
ncbi:MAG TPA: SAM-dependent methyltransferase [Solirubrobacteraceae bacterium]|jgi:cyclopropane fatty-acyl-phospholipid synthase-like methyltransferase|nr:SAM-dependent methyltransferase [Solirubrobacteraceae bacterium]